MNKEDLMAGIVLLNADKSRVISNVHLISQYVHEIVLIDNGSNHKEEADAIAKTCSIVKVIRNEKNMGIAAALNQIINYADSKNYQWVMTLDQDSVPDENMLPHMMKTAHSTIGMVVPRLVDQNVGKTIKNGQPIDETEIKPREIIKNAKDVMTSGCLMNMNMVKNVGLFDEKLFIDYVDIDYNERVLRAGYMIVRDNQAILWHELGKSEIRHFLGHNILVDNHSALRRYYMTRNRLYVAKKYYGMKGYIKEYIKVILTRFKILLFEDNKGKKLNAIKQGIRDEKTL